MLVIHNEFLLLF
uniref:Uncharacterized protein n=1 Tax=Anguilla anguilla TaxID=7936 RepID=A0A0E9SBZ8_ANGAN